MSFGSGREENSLEEGEPREDDTAAAIYADYTSRLPQLDGNEELEENLHSISSSIDQLDGITDDIYSRYNERLEKSKYDYIESPASHSNSYQDSSYSPWVSSNSEQHYMKIEEEE